MTDKELFLKCAQKADIKVADYTMTRVKNYAQAVIFFRALRLNNVVLGIDMASQTCSGNVKIMEESQGCIYLMEKDNPIDDWFKFKEMIVMNGKLEDPDYAPEIFIEADTDIEWLRTYSKDGYQHLGEGRYWGLKSKSEERIIYDKKIIKEYLAIEEESCYNSEIVVPPMRKFLRNTNREMFAYINVQECRYRNDGRLIIYERCDYTCDDIIKVFSPKYKEI